MTPAQYRKLAKRKKPSRYRSTKVEYFDDGVKKIKDSKKEYRRMLQLKEQQKEGLISELKESVTFVLQDSIVGEDGKVIERAIKYIADFTYNEKGRKIVEDVKSEITKKKDAYIIKRKLFKKKFPEYEFRET